MSYPSWLVAAVVIAPLVATAEPRTTKPAEVVANGGRIQKLVEFEFGKARIYSKQREQLAEIAQMCRTNPSVKIVVEGHSFAYDEEVAIALGQHRADVVRGLLVRYGVDPRNVTAVDMSREGEPGRYVDIVVER